MPSFAAMTHVRLRVFSRACLYERRQIGRPGHLPDGRIRDALSDSALSCHVFQGCQVGLFEAKYDKFGLFFKQLASKIVRIY